jgi:anti-sigma B factor antagonist
MASQPARRRRLEVEDIGDIAVVNFVDKKILDEQNIQMIGDDLFRLVDELGRRKVLLNFGNVEFMSSAALGKLITLHRKLRAKGWACWACWRRVRGRWGLSLGNWRRTPLALGS